MPSLLVCLLLGSPLARAASNDLQTMLSPWGVSVEEQQTKNLRAYEFAINKRELMIAMPDLQSAGLINRDLDETFINRHQVTLIMIAAQDIAVAALTSIYKSKDADLVNMSFFLMSPDEFGHPQKKDLFRFSFTRALFEKIDWDNFEMQNFPKIAPKFKISPWLATALAREN